MAYKINIQSSLQSHSLRFQRGRWEEVLDFLFVGCILLILIGFGTVLIFEGIRTAWGTNGLPSGFFMGLPIWMALMIFFHRLPFPYRLHALRGTNLQGNRTRVRSILEEMGWDIRYDNRHYMIALDSSGFFHSGRQFSIIYQWEWIYLSCITFNNTGFPHGFFPFSDKRREQIFLSKWHEAFHSPSHQTLSA